MSYYTANKFKFLIPYFDENIATYISTASFDFPALINSYSASANFPSSSKNMAYFRWMSGNLDFIAVRDKSNANSKALKTNNVRLFEHFTA